MKSVVRHPVSWRCPLRLPMIPDDVSLHSLNRAEKDSRNFQVWIRSSLLPLPAQESCVDPGFSGAWRRLLNRKLGIRSGFGRGLGRNILPAALRQESKGQGGDDARKGGQVIPANALAEISPHEAGTSKSQRRTGIP